MRVRVKICGITRIEDALVAVEAGADALGFIFHPPSPRHLDPRAAGEIICQLPPLVSKVGVFVNAPEETIWETVRLAGTDTLQLHGEESPEFCRRFRPLTVYRAFRIRDASSLERLPAYDTTGWLLDSEVHGQAGGSGERFDWDLAIQATRLGKPIVLAGGLTPDNVAAAIRQVRPYGVDVSSGVESRPGRKDPARLRAFLEAVRGACS